MNPIQKKTPTIADRGWYPIRVTDQARTAPVALRNTTISTIEVSRYEIIV